MLTRVLLAAGVAALAIAAPAYADKGGHGGGGGHGNGGGGGAAFAPQGGGGGHGHGGGGGGHGGGGGGAPAFVPGGGGGGHGHGGGGGQAPQAFFGGGGGHGRGGGGGQAQAFFGGGGGHGHGHGGGAAPQMRAERQQGRGFEHQQSRGFERQQARNVERQHGRGFERQQARNSDRQRGRGFEGQQARNLERQNGRGFERQQARNFEGQKGRGFERHQAFVNQFNGERLNGKAARFANREAAQNWNAGSYRSLAYANNVQVLPVPQVEQFVGVPVAQVANFAALSPLPATIQYLYPDTPDYYFRYGDGYLYQVDRTSSLIDALIPLMAGGFLPGQYLPASYMNSYVPAYYGFNSFYPDYGDVCNRYYEGVVYQVDCNDGFVENVIPMYAGGYGVGQILPSAYSYYNVPTQYRSMYYDTPDYGYWYSPGAIYQYDTRSSMITSVAALLSPGFTIGQPLPMGYDVYNVPYDYRATYYDTPTAWYRYSNGYIYQVDPATQLVTAIVASLLT